MKNKFKLLGIIVLVALIGFFFASCGDEGGSGGTAEPPKTAMYSGAAADGSVYTLKIIEKSGKYAAQDGDSYILYLVKDGITKTSSGTVTVAGSTLTLKPASATVTFEIVINETGITSITGTITFTDNTTAPEPGPITPLPDAPENWPAVERWFKYNIENKPANTATLDYVVDNNGVCAITVGGKAVPPLNGNDGTDGETFYWNSLWRATACYAYTITAGKAYTYTFEAWTDADERPLNIQWYQDNDSVVYLATGWDTEGDWNITHCPPVFKITPTKTTYTLKSDGALPKSYIGELEFQCANQTGKFYVRMISITSEDAPIVITPSSFDAYLATLPDNSEATPYDVRMKISLLGDSGWWECWVIRDALHNHPNKFVRLDLNSDNVPIIEGSSFENCVNLLGIILPDSITTIKDWAFIGCGKLASVTLGSNVTTIMDGAFADCGSLASLTIPNKVNSIGDWAFGGCDNLTSVTFQGNIPSGAFHDEAFPGDLREKFYASNAANGTPGTYTRASGDWTWTKQ
jgi:hypothetical protein